MELFQLLGKIAIDNAAATAKLDETTSKAKNATAQIENSMSEAEKASGKSMEGIGESASEAFGGIGESARKGLTEAQKRSLEVTDGIGKACQKVGGKLTNFITKPAMIATTALAGMVIHKGWSRMTQIDEAKAKLTGLGNSAKDVKTIMANAMTAVKGTAFGMDEAATTAAAAVAAGIKPGKELERYLTLVGDAATIAGTNMGDMGSIFNKVAANGKISAEEMNQLADRGIPIWQLLAESTGKSMDQVRKEVSSGSIKIGEFQTAIEKGMGGAAQNGGKTVRGAMKNVGAALGRVGANFLGASDDAGTFSSQLVAAMNDAKEWLGGAEEKAKKCGKTFGSVFGTTVKIFKALPTSVKVTGAAFTLAAGPALKLAGAVIRSNVAMAKFKAAAEGMSVAQGVLTGQITASNVVLSGMWSKLSSLSIAINPMALTIAGVTAAAGGLAFAFYKVYQSTHQATMAANDMVKEHAKTVVSTRNQAESQAKSAEIYSERLDQLMSKEHQSANDKKLIKTYVDKLNHSVHGLNLKYDEEKNKLNQTSEAIHKKIQAQKEAAIQNAYIKQGQEALDKYAESQVKLAEAEEALKTKEQEVSDARKKGYTNDQMQRELREAKAKVDDLTKATATYSQEAQKQQNMAQIATGAWDQIIKKAGYAGKEIPASLTRGIKNGTYQIPATVSELNALIKFDKMAENAKGSSQKAVNNIKEQLSSGNMTVKEATAELNKAMKKEMDKAPSTAKKAGKKSGKGYATGVSSTKSTSKSAGKSLASATKSGAGATSLSGTGKKHGKELATGVKSASGENKKAGKSAAESAKKGARGVKMNDTGSNLARGIASGITSGTHFIESAARSAIDRAKSAANKRAEVRSPSRVFRDEVGVFLAKGVAVGMEQEIPTIEAAAQNMIDAAKVKATYSFGSDVSVDTSGNPMIPVSGRSNQDEILMQILALLRELTMNVENQKILWNDRELGRMVRTYAR